MVRRILIKGYGRKGYRKDIRPGPGVKIGYIKPTKVEGHFRKDTGAPGKTPKSKQWFEPSPETLHGWEKGMSTEKRRRLAGIARSDLSSARALNQLANLTADRETKKVARADADYFFRRHRESKQKIIYNREYIRKWEKC